MKGCVCVFNPLTAGFLAAGASDLIQSILTIWTAMCTWFISTMGELLNIFYDPTTGITILGIMAFCGIGVGLIFLLIGLVRKFFKFG